MVAEPVQATLQTLNLLYNKASDFIATQQDKIVNSEYLESLKDLNAFSSDYQRNQIVKQSSRYSIGSKLWNNVINNKFKYISILTIGVGIGTYTYFQKPSIFKRIGPVVYSKRRVPKLTNGARRDVILVIGSPTEPLTRLIALDFEKRGFIVYLTILDEKDFKYVESNPITDDINYLNLSEDAWSYEAQISKFQRLLDMPIIPFPGSDEHTLRLVSVVFAPSLYFPIGPIENITVASWSRINERFLVYLKLLASGLINLIRSTSSKVIIINTSIISSLNMPYHAPETMFQNGLKHLFTSLSRETSQHNLSITQVRLGNLHISNTAITSGRINSIVNSEIRSWNEEMKSLYATDFSRAQFKSNPIKTTGRGTNLRELHHLLFDLIYSKSKNPSVVYCGTGARLYDWISRICPDYIIEWFLK